MALTELAWVNCPKCYQNFQYPFPSVAVEVAVTIWATDARYDGRRGWQSNPVKCPACGTEVWAWFRRD